MKHRERERDTHRQTDRDRDKETERHRDRERERDTEKRRWGGGKGELKTARRYIERGRKAGRREKMKRDKTTETEGN